MAKFTALLLTLAFVLMCGSGCRRKSADRNALPADGARIDDRGSFLIYVPARSEPTRKMPLVLALSPGGDAAIMISTWIEVTDHRGWIIAASKEFRNGIEYETVLKQVDSTIETIERTEPVDSSRIVLSGLSGGAMAAHAFLQRRPGKVRAVVANTGMLEEAFMTENYPVGKLAVFLASPADFRYQEMSRDRLFLEAKGWKTKWIEFSGGHVLAPATAYEQAAAWLEQHW